MLNDVTPLILTYNEAPNLARTLDRLAWARDIVIVDSMSSDETRAIAATYPAVRVFERPFTTHAEQWNFGLQQTGIASTWVLALDADFVVPDAVVREIEQLAPPSGVDGYRASFTYCVGGAPLGSAVYPPVTVLYRRAQAMYLQDGHTQRVRLQGRVLPLTGRILHDDRKPLSGWFASQVRYMRLEAEKLSTAGSLGVADRIRTWIVVAPPLMLLLCLFGRGGVLDGRAGLFYALQRTAAELILSLSLLERRLLGAPPRDRA